MGSESGFPGIARLVVLATFCFGASPATASPQVITPDDCSDERVYSPYAVRAYADQAIGFSCDHTEAFGSIVEKGTLGVNLFSSDELTKSIRFFGRVEQCAKFERVAVLADRTWNAEVSRLQEVTNLPIRRFPPSDRQSALAWLESNT